MTSIYIMLAIAVAMVGGKIIGTSVYFYLMRKGRISDWRMPQSVLDKAAFQMPAITLIVGLAVIGLGIKIFP